MNQILKILCIVHFGIFQTAHAMVPIPAFLKDPIETVKAYFYHKENATSSFDADPKAHLLMAHIHVLQELKNKFNALKEKNELNNSIRQQTVTEKKLTQTEAYLKKYQYGVVSKFSKATKKYKTLIESIIEREKELSETHYFFYHAHDKKLIILHDFIKLLDTYMQLIAPRLNFTCMRFKNTLTLPYQNVDEYLDDNSNIHDHNSFTTSQMISVNLALFGNHTDSGECTFRYFLDNTSMSGVNLKERLSPIFSHYGFNTKFLTELTELSSYLTSPTGNLLQICIPHDMVDDLVYLSRPFGKPYNKVVLKKHYDYAKKRHTSLRPLLEQMRRSPDAIDDLSDWQARLMFFDPMVNMDSAIKVFRHNTITPENMTIYQQKLQHIVIQLILDYLKRVNMPKNNVPLNKLCHYMMRHNN